MSADDATTTGHARAPVVHVCSSSSTASRTQVVEQEERTDRREQGLRERPWAPRGRG